MNLNWQQNKKHRRGMTLIELITAMMVSVILLGTAFTTFWTATRAWEKAKRRTELIRLIDSAADVITRHVRAIQPPFFMENSAFVAVNDGDNELNYDGISFLSSANARFPRQLAYADLCEIEFYLETGERGEFEEEQNVTAANEGGLWMRIDPTPDDDLEAGGYLLCLGEQIVSLDFRFFDGYEWVEDWFYEAEVPEAIEFSLVAIDSQGLENPMSLTRLIHVPLAKTINGDSGSEQEDFGETDTESIPQAEEGT